MRSRALGAAISDGLIGRQTIMRMSHNLFLDEQFYAIRSKHIY